jgi:hypothetical protein
LLLLEIYSWLEPAEEGQLKSFYDIIIMGHFIDSESQTFGQNVVQCFAGLIDHYLPKYPLDDLLRDSFLQWQSKMEKTDISSNLESAKQVCYKSSTLALWKAIHYFLNRTNGPRSI